MRSLIVLLFFQFIGIVVFSQEVLNDLYVNPILINKKDYTPLKAAKTSLELPFFEDFSTISSYPSSERWVNTNVFVNATYGVSPPSIGVATFDAVNAKGYIYESLSDVPSPSDTLTSQPINLSAADENSTYLSFYYQPQGYGEAPELNDSLVLNVIANDSVYRIWYANGTDYWSFKQDTLKIGSDRPDTLEFKLVNLKLDNAEFYTDNFQFQFINYVSISGISNPSGRTNVDHWHVDYILLDENRSEGDTIFSDLAMVAPSTLFMKEYSSVPWNHFQAAINEQFSNLSFHVRNNDSKDRSMKQLILNINDVEKGTIYDYYIGQRNMYPFENRTDILSNFPRSPIEWYKADSAVFEVTGELQVDGEDHAENNFTSRIVKFKDYYAYDDGTAEKAYGVDNNRAKVAYKYEIAKGDSLRAVQMYFVRNKEEYSSVQSFTFCIWGDYNDGPGSVILKETGKRPEYTDDLNGFVTIDLDSVIYLEGVFYIGWEQTTDLLMNVGFDANTIRNEKLFYNVNSNWYETEYKGSLMMRPVFGGEQLGSSIKENKVQKRLHIGPNPSDGYIRLINESEFASGTIHIFNYLGKMVFEKEVNTSENIDVNHLINGMYVVTFIPENGLPKSTRLILTK